MSVEENIRNTKAAYEAISARDWDTFAKYLAESVVFSGAGLPEPIKGREALVDFTKAYIAAFPDIRVTTERAFGQGDWVCLEHFWTGTHKGPLQVPGGQTIPATNKAVRIQEGVVIKVEEGQATEVHAYSDQLGLMAQLGLAP